jgi:hypothetical protein
MIDKWEAKFSQWAQPPGDAEETRIQNAIKGIRDALDSDPKLKNTTRVFVQGSYRNRVNVRQDSDVDIGVLYTGGTFYPEYPQGTASISFGNIESVYSVQDFKRQIYGALVARFSASGVTWGDKALDVHANTYRVDADVVPLFEHRRYSPDGSFLCGVELRPDSGGRIINWPEQLYPHWPRQHYEHAVTKNVATRRAYKGVVRILRKLRYIMEAEGNASAKEMKGFLIECLVCNVPNEHFAHETWGKCVRAVLCYLWSNTREDAKCLLWREVSQLKYIFLGEPVDKRVKANRFILDAWSHIGIAP